MFSKKRDDGEKVFSKILVKKPFLVRVNDGVRYVLVSQPLIVLVVVFLFFTFVLFVLAKFTIPKVQVENMDVMRLIYQWNGRRVSTDWVVCMMFILFFVDNLWLRYRTQIPQGDYFAKR